MAVDGRDSWAAKLGESLKDALPIAYLVKRVALAREAREFLEVGTTTKPADFPERITTPLGGSISMRSSSASNSSITSRLSALTAMSSRSSVNTTTPSESLSARQ